MKSMLEFMQTPLNKRPVFLQSILFLTGCLLIALAYTPNALANLGTGHTIYNDMRISDATNAVLTYLEGSLGALVMVAAGVGAILSAAFGQYRSALGLMIVSLGSFILRSLVGTFFNDVNLRG